MPDAVEALWQDVEQEAADKFVSGERHHLLSPRTAAAIILIAEGDAILVEAAETAVRDGDPVGVTRQIGEHGFGPCERRLRIDHPALFTDRRQVTQESPARGKMCQVAEEGELPRVVQPVQPGEEQPAEQLTEHADREKEGRTRRYPPAAIGRDSTACHDHMDVGVMGERGPPGMKDGGDADASAKVSGIGRDRQHRLRCRPEQQIIDRRLVVEGDLRDLGGYGEHDVEVADRQQVGLALGEPGACGCALALRTMPVATAVIGDPPVAAVLTGLNVTAKSRSTTMLDRRHHPELMQAQVPGMGCPICRPRGTEDVGDLKRGAQ